MPSELVEKLKQERLERQKQRQAELEKYEQELAARREQRKQERQSTRLKEVSSDQTMSNLTRKTIEDSFKRSDIRKLEADVKRREMESALNSLKNKRDADREIFDIKKKRMKELALLRRKRKIPPRPKRYTIHPTEFYGIDFSVSAHVDQVQQELFNLSRKREAELLQNPDYFNELMKAGNAFVKALAETTSMDHAKVEQLLRKKRFNGSLQSVSELNEEEIDKETLEQTGAYT